MERQAIPMSSESILHETDQYRCLVYQDKQTNDIFLSLCGVERCLPGYEFHTKQRTGYHLHVILAGRGFLHVDGTDYPLHDGQMFVTKPGEETWYRADEKEPWQYCWMTFDGNNAARYAENAGFQKGVNWRDCHVDRRQFYTLVERTLNRPEMTISNDLYRLGMLLEYISLAVESNDVILPSPHREEAYSSDVYVDYAVTHIQSNYANAKIGDVARFIGINRSYLSNLFRQRMGVSPQEYLMQCKLEQARRLLLETDAPVQDIARRVGYDNPLTFSKIFKGSFGVSPKTYRRQKREYKENLP